METMSHGDLRFLSLRNWDVAMEPKEQFQTGEGSKCLREGGRTVVDVLSEGLNVQMGEVVTEVRYDTGGVNVFTKGGATVSADRCIVTVPIGVLKSDALEFHPELPERKRKAIQQIGVTTMNKVRRKGERARDIKKEKEEGRTGWRLLNVYGSNSGEDSYCFVSRRPSGRKRKRISLLLNLKRTRERFDRRGISISSILPLD